MAFPMTTPQVPVYGMVSVEKPTVHVPSGIMYNLISPYWSHFMIIRLMLRQEPLIRV